MQRVLKYPLLLRELVSLTDCDSEEHYHLTGEPGELVGTHLSVFCLGGVFSPLFTPVLVPAEALKAMEKVASHINEMQKIYEDYGSVFDQLVAEQIGHDKEVKTRLSLVLTLCAPALPVHIQHACHILGLFSHGELVQLMLFMPFSAPGLWELNTFTN